MAGWRAAGRSVLTRSARPTAVSVGDPIDRQSGSEVGEDPFICDAVHVFARPRAVDALVAREAGACDHERVESDRLLASSDVLTANRVPDLGIGQGDAEEVEDPATMAVAAGDDTRADASGSPGRIEQGQSASDPGRLSSENDLTGVTSDRGLEVLERRDVASHLDIDLAAQTSDRIGIRTGRWRQTGEQLVADVRPPDEQGYAGQPGRSPDRNPVADTQGHRDGLVPAAGLEQRHHPEGAAIG